MLEGRHCTACQKLSVGGGQSCPFCGGPGGRPVTVSGRGRLLSWTVIRIAPERYAAETPYAVGLLELEEGPRLTARLAADPERLSGGQPMVLVSVDPDRGPVFAPA